MSSVIMKVRSSVSKRKKKNEAGENRLAEILKESSDLNWQEILEEDSKYMTMLQIAGEITRENVQARISKHSYLANCAYFALLKIINLYFYALDPGEQTLDQDPTWTSVPEPPPANTDTLVGWSVPVLKDVVPVLKEPRQFLSHSSLLQRASRLPVSLDDVPPFSPKAPDVAVSTPEEEDAVKIEVAAEPSVRLSETSIFVRSMAQDTITDIIKEHLLDRPKPRIKHKALRHKIAQQSKMVMKEIEPKVKYLNPALYPAPRVPVTYVVTPVERDKEEKQVKRKDRKSQ